MVYIYIYVYCYRSRRPSPKYRLNKIIAPRDGLVLVREHRAKAVIKSQKETNSSPVLGTARVLEIFNEIWPLYAEPYIVKNTFRRFSLFVPFLRLNIYRKSAIGRFVFVWLLSKTPPNCNNNDIQITPFFLRRFLV